MPPAAAAAPAGAAAVAPAVAEIAALLDASARNLSADATQAEALAHRAVQLATDAGDPALVARAGHALGIARAASGDPLGGLELLDRAVRGFAELGMTRAHSEALRALASVQGNYLNRHDDALESFQRALTLAIDAGDGRGEGHILSVLGALLSRLRRRDEAQAAFERAVVLLRAAGDHATLAKALNNLAYLHVECGRYADAVPVATEAAMIADPVTQSAMLVGIRCTAAIAFAGSGRGDEALALLALDERELASLEPYYVADHWLAAARVWLLLDRPADALPLLERGRSVAKVAKLDSFEPMFLELLADATERTGDHGAALAHRKALRESERRQLDHAIASRVHTVETRLELRQHEQRNAALREAQADLESRVAERTAALAAEVEERRRAERRADHLARHDWLTDLPNRRGLHDALEEAVAAARRDGTLVGALFIDIDRFKRLNDAHGHLLADQVLRIVAERFRGLVAAPSAAFRFGGDEFLLLVRDAAGAQQVMRVAELALDALDHPIAVDRHQFEVACSVGVAIFPDDAAGGDDLLRKADRALLLAKERGRNRVVRLDRAIARSIERRMRLEQDLLHALERREMLLHFQPQWDLRHDRVVGMEALLRWAHPVFGIVPPAEFVPLAEELGTISALGTFALREACRASARLHRKLGRSAAEHLVVGVNVSAQQLRSEALIVDIRGALADSGIEPGCLELELTESLLLSEDALTLARVNAIRNLGVRLALDDFGSGYSSFSYLHRLSFDRLKIDRSIVNESTMAPEKSVVTQAIIAMAHGLGLDVVAEGVETTAQRSLLEAQGCDQIQGFLVAEPITADELASRLRQRVG